ncbi:putative alkaline shock family protein YloU [Anoxybacillus tepidamans]|uniref:Putative alkaline shock family protein YloU n=1 Tax=Anoxybacteroides tepidamans TaxID=265948 RepID=A0A7W8INH3_9BACL|nr:Asp23/Gls24 family envelope stress response protein [Anoxybacillus tepidamans]MBB5323811.1 putative alkaline shock family protein YloU [Anoxybacillus tepidamans]
MREAVRLRRSNVAYSTLVTIVMMCVKEQEGIVAEETVIEVLLAANNHCTITVAVVMKYGAEIIPICKKLQEQIVNEIGMMTPFTVQQVHIIVKRIA